MSYFFCWHVSRTRWSFRYSTFWKCLNCIPRSHHSSNIEIRLIKICTPKERTRTRIVAWKGWRLHGTEELEFPHFMCEDFDQKTSFLPNERFSRVFSIPCCIAILSKCIGLAVSACGAGYTKTWKTVGKGWNVYFFRLKRFRNQAKKLSKTEQQKSEA